jgi:hypothetical protein
MAFGGAGLAAGLSALVPGYQQGEDTQYKLDKERRDALATKAAGSALQMLAQSGMGQQTAASVFGPGGGPQQGPPPGGGMPPQGGAPMQQPGMPQPPQPGQPSMPQQPPGGPQGGPPMGGAPPGMPPGGARPPMPGPQPGMPPGGPQAGGPQGQPPQLPGGRQPLDWRQIVAAVQQSNPNIPPDVLMGAVNQFLPMMTQQSQMEWRQVSLQMREQALQQREHDFMIAEQGRNQRSDTASSDRRYGVDTRADTAAAAETGRDTRAATTEAGRNTRAEKNLGEKQREFAEREQRLQESLKLRTDSTWARLEQQKQQAQQRVEASQGKQGLAEWRAAADAQYRYIRTKIQAESAATGLNAKDKKALLDQAEMQYNEQIGQLREKFGRSTPTGGTTTGPAAPKVSDKLPTAPSEPGKVVAGAPATAGPAPAPGGAMPPPEAISALKEGQVTTFENGQKWTLKNGKPEQVP